jgi:preprotein translocase subunit SecY
VNGGPLPDQAPLRASPLWRRLAVTLGALAFAAAGRQIAPAGLDASALARAVDRSPLASLTSPPHPNVFWLGVGPAISAIVLVELAALAVPRLRGLVHGGPEARARLARAANALALLLAAFQAFGAINPLRLVEGEVPIFHSVFDPALAVVSLVAGFVVLFLAARIVTAHGLVNGLLLFSLVDLLDATRGEIARAASTVDASPAAYFAVAVAVAAACAVGVVASRGAPGPTRASEAGGVPYREGASAPVEIAPWVPVPACSFAPPLIAASIVMLPATLANLRLSLGGLAAELQKGEALFHAANIGLTLGIGWAFAHAFNRPVRIADVLRRVGVPASDALEREARAALGRALRPTVATLLVPTAAYGLLARARVPALSVAQMPLFAAILVEVGAAVVAHARTRDLVCVWEERRAYALPALRALLHARGIASQARGTGPLVLLQVFGAYAPATLWVRAGDAPRAQAILREALLGEVPAPASAGAAAPAFRVGAPSAPLPRWTVPAVAVMVAVALGATVFASRRDDRDASQEGPPVRLAFVRVDDELDAFAAIGDDKLPPGVEIFEESMPAGPGSFARVRFARIAAIRGELPPDSLARFRPWLDTIALPAGRSFGVEEVADYDTDEARAVHKGWRSFVLSGEPILTEADVEDAAVVRDASSMGSYYVSVTFSEAGALRFKDATRELLKRRFAIVVDDVVDSAPVVQAEISGGRASITLGWGDPQEQLRRARRLERGLRKRR